MVRTPMLYVAYVETYIQLNGSYERRTCLGIWDQDAFLHCICNLNHISVLGHLSLFRQQRWLELGAVSIKRCHLTSIGISMLKIRRSHRSSYLLHGDPHTWKRRSLYWDGLVEVAVAAVQLSAGVFDLHGVIADLHSNVDKGTFRILHGKVHGFNGLWRLVIAVESL